MSATSPRERLAAMMRTDRSDMTVWSPGEVRDAVDAYRSAVLREAQREVVAWLVKKAGEYWSTGSQQHRLQADTISTLASKVDRGAIRLFLAAGKDTPTGGESTRDAETCGQCRRPFDPTGTRFDGQARHRDTPFCRSCVDACHESDAFHQCPVCVPANGGGRA